MDWLLTALGAVLQWLLDFILWLPRKITQIVLEGIASFFQSIPAPDWMTGAASAFAGIPSSVLYLVSHLHLDVGVGIILSAYAVRFLIRRIPVIG